MSFPDSIISRAKLSYYIKGAHEGWIGHWQFFATGDTMKDREVEKEFNGLHLPREVIDKIYYANARKWFPGIAGIIEPVGR